MNDDAPLPPEFEALERQLVSIRFKPRASLGPELVGRLRRDERPEGDRPERFARLVRLARFTGFTEFTRWPRFLLRVVAPLLVLLALALYFRRPLPVVVDHCCYDLDGGGEQDDGVLVVAERDARVRRLQVYEDRDQSHRLSPGDLIRLDRGSAPALHNDVAHGLVTIRHCCADLDGGGPDDDALLIIAAPPHRVVMAAIYEQRQSSEALQLR